MRLRHIFICMLLLSFFIASPVVWCADANNAEGGADARQPLTFRQLDESIDSDGDFLVDSFEKALIDTYAPLLVFHPQETCWPSNVNHHLSSAIRMRVYDRVKTAKEEYADGKSAAKPKTWTEALVFCDKYCVSGSSKYEDVYMSLPIDKTTLVPGAPLPSCPEGDFRIERPSGQSTKSVADVYKARVMVPLYRPVGLHVEMIDENGISYKGNCTLNVFSGAQTIPDSISSGDFILDHEGTTLKAELVVKSGLRKALGMLADSKDPMPNGPVFDWTKAEVELDLVGSRIPVSFVARGKSARGLWLENGSKKSAFFETGAVQELAYDIEAIKTVWNGVIPQPQGGAEIYAHVYPVSSFIVVQYWLFYGYSDFDKERHEGDWGDRIDVVLYRDDPNIKEGDTIANPPKGVIPAYRAQQPLGRDMVAMVIYNGSCGKQIFHRAADAPEKFTLSRDIAEKLTADFIPDKLRWADKLGAVSDTGSHPVAFVAKGSHQIYAKGGSHKRLPDYGKINELSNAFKKASDTVSQKDYGTDECARDISKLGFGEGGSSVAVVPQTDEMHFSGFATYGDSVNQVSLKGQGATIHIVNVGELTATRRQTMMRYDGTIYKELKKAWGLILPKKKRTKRKLEARLTLAMSSVLEEPVKAELAKLENSDDKDSKTNFSIRIEDKVKTVQSKLWSKIVDAKDAARKIEPDALDDTLNELAFRIIQGLAGVKRAKVLLVLSNTKPMSGGEFIDYPGRWGRVQYSNSMDNLVRQQNRNFLKYEIPDDDRMNLLLNWKQCGPSGPAGGRPQIYLADFYRDYDSVAEVLMTYGIDISL